MTNTNTEVESTEDTDEKVPLYLEVPKLHKEAVKESTDHGGLSQVVRDALAKCARGEEVFEMEKRNEVANHHLELLNTSREAYQQRIERNSVNGMVTTEQAIAAHVESFLPVIHSIARSVQERQKRVEETVIERESDPEAVTPMADMSMTDAVHEYLFKEDEKQVRRQILTGNRLADPGVNHPSVESAAEKCGMDAENLWRKARQEWPEAFEWLGVDPDAVGGTETQSETGTGLRSTQNNDPVATDGGEPE